MQKAEGKISCLGNGAGERSRYPRSQRLDRGHPANTQKAYLSSNRPATQIRVSWLATRALW